MGGAQANPLLRGEGRDHAVRRHLALGLARLALALLAPPAGAIPTSGPSCATALMPQNLSMPSCPPTTKTLADAEKAAWKFAPIVYVHPLERYLWQSPKDWWDNATVWLPDYVPETNASASRYAFIYANDTLRLLFEPHTFVTVVNSTNITKQQVDAIVAGAPLVNNGSFNDSTADVYYSVVQLNDSSGNPNSAWMFTYNLYYSWNGCSNQALAISYNGSRDTVEYVACPTGVHESDWERVSVLVCAETEELQQTSYSQHDWWETRSAANVTLNGTHPIAYAGLEGHGNYYEPDVFEIYTFINASIAGIATLNNLGGVWIGDRTGGAAPGPLGVPRRFFPSPGNIKRIPDPETIMNQNLTEWYWAAYTGQWGAPLNLSSTTFLCLSDNQTVLQPCPETQSTKALQLAFKLMDVAGAIVGIDVGSAQTNTTFDQSRMDDYYFTKTGSNYSSVGYPKITGPMLREYSYAWPPQRTSPINRQTKLGSIACPDDVVLTDRVELYNIDTGVGSVTQYLIGICAGSLLLSIVIGLLLLFPELLRDSAPVFKLQAQRVGKALDKVVVMGGKAGTAVVGMARKASPTGSRTPSAAALAPDAALEQATAAAAGGEAAEAKASPGSEDVAAASPKAAAADGGDSTTAAAALAAEGEGVVELTPVPQGQERRYVLWVALAACLYVASIVLLGLGLDTLFNESLAAYFVNSSTMVTLKWLFSLGIALVGVADLAGVCSIFFVGRPHVQLGRFKFRNYLGGRIGLATAYKMHCTIVALVVLVITIAALLLALGLTLLVATIVARTVCNTFFNINIMGFNTRDVCVTIPYVSDEELCGWAVLQTCNGVTNMRIRELTLGAILLLWSHLVWLLALQQSSHRFLQVVDGEICHG